ncbi:type VI secretion system tip protein VgrG [Entomomonas moraniae]|uniref:Type VI secretion system tip protein VgrG n=1 Tax=Entomomonas moraniae TaxID=2213226 RepID=A0A3Q9JKA0_9GAMM|nr:type VI secretion system Vgr family protein [Entomomonas moraniae]AZS51498.1 type VI secretion system tip protein VgrG [Entomomonas moraniae]
MFSSANETHFYLAVEGLENSPLQVLAFDGIEGLNAEYVFEITLVSEHLRFDITQLLSKPAYLSFIHDKTQGVHGIIHEVKRSNVGVDYAEYKIALVPRFTHLHKRRNHRAFVGKTVPEIIKTILEEHGILETNDFNFKFKDPSVYTPRELCCQYNESDAHYLYRLCEECGIAIHYEFTQTHHKMILNDAQPFFKDLPNPLTYRSNTGFVADEPVLKRFDVGLVSNPLTSSERNYNFKNKKIPESSFDGIQSSKANQASEPNLEHYHFPGRLNNEATAKQQAQLSIERLRTNQILAEAYGDIPTLHVGLCFTVKDFPALNTMAADELWLIKQIKHQGRQPQVLEALGSQSSADSDFELTLLPKYFKQPIAKELQFPSKSLQQGYRNCLIATPKNIAYRPQRVHFKHKVIGTQTALITGPAGEEIYCDEYGRVKLQFHWDRLGNYDEHSSHWVRVANIWAHNKYGGIEIPRIGMEVMVDFLEGDIDNPIIRGAVHNGVNQVPYDLPGIKTQSTLKTKEYKGGGYNEVLLDDTTGEVKTQIHSTPGTSQLNLGFLTHPRKSDGGGEHRGNGFELRTDDWGAIRAGKGIYLTADERITASSTQLDLEEAIKQLESSLILAKNLAKSANRAGALTADTEDQKQQLDSVFTELKQAGILASAPSGIALVTPRSLQLSADQNLTFTANNNADISVAQSYRVVAGEAVSLLATNDEMKLVAHKERIRVQANDNNVEIIADKTVKIVSANDKITVAADKELLLTCAGAYIKLANGDIQIHAPGIIDHKASSYPYQGPTSLDLGFEGLPKGDTYDLQIKLVDEVTGDLIKNTKYQMHLSNGQILEGITDENALTKRAWSTEKLIVEKITLLDYRRLKA